MRRQTTQALLAALLTVLAVACLPARAATPATSTAEPVCTESSQYGPLRHYCGYFPASTDGVLLAWQVYLPDARRFGPGPYPTVLDYSGYSPASTFYDGLGSTFLDQGYAVAGVNIRGTGCSGGTFDYFEPKEWKDGYDAVEFLAARSWSSGDVAMVGKSYPGITQLYVAPMRPPHLRAIVPGAFFSDAYRDVAYPGGIQDAVFTAGFSLVSQPGNTLDAYDKNVREQQDPTCVANQVGHATNPAYNPFVQINSHPYDDQAEYADRGPYALAPRVQVPVMVQLAWQDEELGARGIDYVDRLPKGTPWRAVLTNGDHGEYYDAFVKAEVFRFLALYVKHQVAPGDPCATVVTRRGHRTTTRTATYRESVACYQAEPRVLVGFENGPQR
ncbi:MAG: CocE/NonD family hydrolase, partial [Mycobacteriales bacterium]